MQSRRTFVKSTSLLTAAAVISPSMLSPKKKSIGVQLYTVRDAMHKDPAGTLEKVARIGYNAVEAATYTGTQDFYGLSPKAFAGLLKQNGLVMPGSHYRLGEEKERGKDVQGTMLHGWDKAVSDAKEAGAAYMVCAYLSERERGGPDRYRYVAEQLNKAGEVCKKAGLQLCYHNHDFEFIKQGDQLPYDILLNETDKDLVKMEMDLYWATKAGHDPIAIIEQHPGRFPLWHVKDMDNTPKKYFTEVGSGVIDFKPIFAKAKKAGMQYFFVEQDVTPGSPFDSIAKSFEYLKRTLKVV